jgi:Ras-related protein Rab-5C
MIARKVMLLGEIGVGKSSIVQRLVFDRFDLSYKPTIGVDVYKYELPERPGHGRISLIIWDTDGNFGEAIFKHVYMKEAAAAIVLADIARPQTVATMGRLVEGFREALPGRYVASVLNKADLVQHPHETSAPIEVTRAGIPLYRTSAKTGDNVQSVFLEAADAILRRKL